MKKWDALPNEFKNEAVRPYYDCIKRKWFSRFWKRFFDIVVSLFLILVLSPLFLILILVVACSSKGPVFFVQERVTTYGRHFGILKFRTMVADAEKLGPQITANDDKRITKVGRFLRKSRLDEIPQLFNVFVGQMSFVGTRPEVPYYVAKYQPEWYATLLMPAGVTAEASIRYRDEDKLLTDPKEIEQDYLEKVLPDKMVSDLAYLKRFNVFYDIHLMFKTFFSLFRK
jgi:lipopolysaccharide/colanic/teichoic acid biosynthesis glycosyltransferase